MLSKPMGGTQMPGQELSPHRASCMRLSQAGYFVCGLCTSCCTASSNRCWTLCEAVLGKTKTAASLMHHLHRSNLLSAAGLSRQGAPGPPQPGQAGGS